MNNTKSEYTKRVSELDLYLNTLILLDKGQCSITAIDINGINHTENVDENLSRILKANGFLLLYNLIESTIRNSIKDIIEELKNQGLKYNNITPDLKKLWIKQELKNKEHEDNIRVKVENIAESIAKAELLLFNEECVTISGNIDAKEIRKIAKQIGYAEPTDGAGLVIIKNKRNHLAHGEFTFSEIGKDYSINDIMIFKNEACTFLNNVIANIETFLNNSHYKAIP